jgi:hypothetical protein
MMPDVPRGTSQTSETSHTSQNPDLSTWLTKAQAAEAIGVSTKTIEQFAKAGKIQQAAWRPQNRGAEKAVYHPDDVARIAAARRPGLAPFVLPAGVTPPVNGNGHHGGNRTDLQRIHTDPDDPIRQLAVAFERFLLAPPLPPASEKSSEKWFLTIPEAAALSGLSEANLRRRCQSGWPGAIKDGAWKIRRRDLEAL